MKIKICGICEKDDALAAAELGADFVGLIFEPESPRFVRPFEAEKIAASLYSSKTKLVGVFVNQSISTVRYAIFRYGLAAVQLHGFQTQTFADALKFCGVQVWKTFWLNSNSDFNEAKNFRADKILIDARNASKLGGTGMLSNWKLAKKLSLMREIILAGAISSENASRAAFEVSPYALDANSAIEDYPRKKNILKMKKLIEEIKNEGK